MGINIRSIYLNPSACNLFNAIRNLTAELIDIIIKVDTMIIINAIKQGVKIIGATGNIINTRYENEVVYKYITRIIIKEINADK
jgi:hypothetical protein